MILGMGIDLVELNRLKELKDDRFVSRVLSEDEKLVYDQISAEQTKLTYLGGRFAAKEAIFKAIAKGPGSTNYNDFSILNDENGKPFIKTNFFKHHEILHISITHTNDYAIAYVIIESR